MYKNILLPLNKSEFDDDAIATAVNMARICNGSITLMQVLDILPLLPSDRKEQYQVLKGISDTYLQPLKQKIEQSGITATIVQKTGKPAFVLREYIAANSIDLIIMPVYDREKDKIFIGSVAGELLKYSPKPILFVRSPVKDLLKGMNVLVVDDEPDILDTVEEELSMCIVHKAKSRDEALACLNASTYGMVILDIMGVDGFNVLQHAVKKGMPTIMLTAHSLTKEALKKAAELGATSFLPKEKITELATFIGDVVQNNGKPAWKKLFARMSNYFQDRIGWTPEEEQAVVESCSDFDDK
jgi:nucleotide-binding universal stress UspA family protein/CheY-like chemotaxis protein